MCVKFPLPVPHQICCDQQNFPVLLFGSVSRFQVSYGLHPIHSITILPFASSEWFDFIMIIFLKDFQKTTECTLDWRETIFFASCIRSFCNSIFNNCCLASLSCIFICLFARANSICKWSILSIVLLSCSCLLSISSFWKNFNFMEK